MFKVGLNVIKPFIRTIETVTKPSSLEACGQIFPEAKNVIGETLQLGNSTGITKTVKEILPELERGVTGATKKLFKSYEEFKTNFLERLREHKGNVSEKLYTMIENTASSNKFELVETYKKYYEGLLECKTMKDVAKMYPEFAHLNVDRVQQLTNTIKSSIPESVCQKAMQFSTKEKRINFIMSYLNNNTRASVLGWSSYPDIVRTERKIASEIAEGLYNGNPIVKEGAILFDQVNIEPTVLKLIKEEDRDNVLISFIKKYYIEGKKIDDIEPIIVNNQKIIAKTLNKADSSLRFACKEDNVFRKFIAFFDEEAAAYKGLLQLSENEIKSAVMKKAWTSSGLKAMLNYMIKRKGWSSVPEILRKRKNMSIYPSYEDIINRSLLMKFKKGEQVLEANPYKKFEQVTDYQRIQKWVNFKYNSSIMPSERKIIESSEFKAYKAKFNIEEMQKSLMQIEDHYVNIFFKQFWQPERCEAFSKALKNSYEAASKNIEMSETMLHEILTESII